MTVLRTSRASPRAARGPRRWCPSPERDGAKTALGDGAAASTRARASPAVTQGTSPGMVAKTRRPTRAARACARATAAVCPSFAPPPGCPRPAPARCPSRRHPASRPTGRRGALRPGPAARPAASRARDRRARRVEHGKEPLLGGAQVLDGNRNADHAPALARIRRARATSRSGSVMRSSAVTGRTPASWRRRGADSVALVDGEGGEPWPVGGRDTEDGDGKPARPHERARRPGHGGVPDDRAHGDAGGARVSRACAMPGTARIGPIDVMGFDGHTTMRSASRRLARTPGAGRAAAAPAYSTPSTSLIALSRTKYSWK